MFIIDYIGVKVFGMKIQDLKPRKNVNLLFKVIEKKDERTTKDGRRVSEAIVGDETGIVYMTLWEDEIDSVEVGKTYSLRDGYVTLFRGSMRLVIGRNGVLEEAEEDIENIRMDNNLSLRIFPDYRGGRYRGRRR